MSERASDMCAYPRVRHQILWTFFFFFSIGWCWNTVYLYMHIHLLSTNWLTLKSYLTDRLFLIHFSCLSACLPATAGGIHLKFTLVVVGRAHEYSLRWVNAWTHFFFFLSFVSIFFLFVLFCFVLFPLRLIFFSPLIDSSKLIWYAGGLAIFNCKWV